MRRGMAIALVVLVVIGLVSGCSSGDDGSSSSTAQGSTGTTVAGGGRTAAELEGALLQPAQLPAGWTVAAAPSTSTSDPSTRHDVLCSAGIATFDDDAPGLGHPQAQVAYRSGPVQLVQSVGSVPPGEAAAVVQGVAAALAACDGQTWTAGGVTWTSILPASPPAPGSVSSRLVGTGSDGPIAIDVVAIPVEGQDVVVELTLVQPGDSGVEQATLDQLTQGAIAGAQAL